MRARKIKLLEIRKAFMERYKTSKALGQKFYTEYFAKQIREIDKELKEMK